MKMYMVGGYVRDEIMGTTSKDIDFTVVLEPFDFPQSGTVVAVPSPFEVMSRKLREQGFKIFVESPEYLTIRAQFPGDEKRRMTADFVLARKEGTYTDGRRPDKVVIGTLYDDLARRDFTMNAIAKHPDTGEYIDPYNGMRDIANGVIRAVGDPFERLTEDALRAVRALRFSVTKDMRIENSLAFSMESAAVLDAIDRSISDERIDEELRRMFAYDTLASLDALAKFPSLTRAMFSGSVSLTSTMKKGRR